MYGFDKEKMNKSKNYLHPNVVFYTIGEAQNHSF